MTAIFRVSILSCLILLMGCAHRIHPQLIKACKLQCQQQLRICNQQCKNNCPQCSCASGSQMSKMFDRFVRNQKIQGAVLWRELKSYRDPLQCHKTTCDCQADYRVCTQACNGIITKKLRVPPACC